MDWARQSSVFRINPQELTVWSQDKATMHLEFISRRLDTPYTILLSSCQERPDLTPLDLSPLGGRFAIKPASLGGGEGVVLEATSQEQVSFVRKQYPHEKYLLQAHVMPAGAGGTSSLVPRAGLRRGGLSLLVGPAHAYLYPCVSGGTIPIRAAGVFTRLRAALP